MSATEAQPQVYTLEAETQAQIDRLTSAPRTRLAALALEGREPAREETLVHLIRLLRREGDGATADALLRGLMRRIESKVGRTVVVWGLGSPPTTADEVIDDVLIDFCDRVLSEDPAETFWEVRFWVCLERRLLNVLRKWRYELGWTLEATEDELGDTAFDREPATLAWDEQPETQALVAEALALLPPEWRTAFVLKHWAGLQEEVSGGSADRQSIASVMGISGRTVRNYLLRAEKRLARWRADPVYRGLRRKGAV